MDFFHPVPESSTSAHLARPAFCGIKALLRSRRQKEKGGKKG